MIFRVIKNRFKISFNLGKVAEAAFSVLGDKKGEIELAFVNEKEMQELNLKYRGQDKATDVLSFVVDTRPLMGQIVICYTKAKEQAKLYGESLKEEIQRLLVHGLVHLYGYDHENKADEVRMLQIEETIRERIKNG